MSSSSMRRVARISGPSALISPLADLFDMQDEIVARLANQLGTQLVAAEARRAEQAPHPDSMDLYFRGMACANKGHSPQNMMQAREFFERALARDPAILRRWSARRWSIR